MHFTHTKPKSDGFTIIELMIALSVMSIILIMSTVILIQIGGLYDKGVTAANLQNTSRNLLNEVSSDIEFSGFDPAVAECAPTAADATITSSCASDPYPNEYAYCIGTVRYSFIPYSELGIDISANPETGSQPGVDTPNILWRDNLQSYSDPCEPVDLSLTTASLSASTNNYAVANSGYEIMSAHTRLTNFSISSASGTGGYNVYDVTVSTAYGDSGLLNLDGNNTTCNSQVDTTATQFCSTSTVSSTVNARVY